MKGWQGKNSGAAAILRASAEGFAHSDAGDVTTAQSFGGANPEL
jgi:hypothetical protein